MLQRIVVPILLLATVVACSDHPNPAPTTPTAATDAPPPARERLAARLALALADPALRAELAAKFAASHAPEGKLQFQALAQTGDRLLLARLAAAGDGSMTTLLADMVAARGLEIYLPVPAHRAAWQGGEDFLVGTLEQDGDRPVAFDATGRRTVLDASRPPEVPVIALVPQEFDFTGGNPANAMMCWDLCSGGGDGGGGSGGVRPPESTAGLFLVATEFLDSHEGWLKGDPEFEFHVYGEVSGDSEQLSCTGEHAGGPYAWDTDNLTWHGSAALLTKADIDSYIARNRKAVVRIVAWEDDDTPCVPVSNGNTFTDMVKKLDAVYRQWTGGKITSSVGTGLEAAVAAYGLAKSVRSFILTSDDIIGHAVESSVVGWAPGNANFILKGPGTKTTGWFETAYRE